VDERVNLKKGGWRLERIYTIKNRREAINVTCKAFSFLFASISQDKVSVLVSERSGLGGGEARAERYC
jgi:hypothetical protein